GRPKADRRTRVRLVPRSLAPAREHLDQGQLPRAPVLRWTSREERRARAVPRCRPVRAPRGRDGARPRPLGHRLAAPKPERPHARRRPVRRFPPPHRREPRAAKEALGHNPHAPLLARRKDGDTLMALDKPYLDIPGTTIFDAEQSRKGYALNQFCMS